MFNITDYTLTLANAGGYFIRATTGNRMLLTIPANWMGMDAGTLELTTIYVDSFKDSVEFRNGDETLFCTNGVTATEIIIEGLSTVPQK